MKGYKPQEPTLTVSATLNAMIALGHVITLYLEQIERGSGRCISTLSSRFCVLSTISSEGLHK